VRSGPGEARTILLLHIISVRPSKQPLMVRTFLKVYMELGSYFLFLQEQIKDIIIRRWVHPLMDGHPHRSVAQLTLSIHYRVGIWHSGVLGVHESLWVFVFVFITAVPNIKLFLWGEGNNGGHVLQEMMSRGLCGLVCPSRTSERGGEGDCVKEGGGGEGERERERALGLLL
jgi:hypothetical protein